MIYPYHHTSTARCEEGGEMERGVLKDQTPAHSTQSKKTHPEILIKGG
jgi:hypothetical protein